jgi:hypothetical protein
MIASITQKVLPDGRSCTGDARPWGGIRHDVFWNAYKLLFPKTIAKGVLHARQQQEMKNENGIDEQAG